MVKVRVGRLLPTSTFISYIFDPYPRVWDVFPVSTVETTVVVIDDAGEPKISVVVLCRKQFYHRKTALPVQMMTPVLSTQ